MNPSHPALPAAPGFVGPPRPWRGVAGLRLAAAWAAASLPLLGAAARAADGVEIHVAAEAAPAGDGTERLPHRTLAEARDAIRRARSDGTLPPGVPVTVLVAPGTYRLDATFELTAEDGGTAGAPVVYRGRERRQARIQGGTPLAADAFRPVDDERVLARLDPAVRRHVVVCDVSALAPVGGFAAFKPAYRGAPAGPWLYADGRPLTLARWPNADAADGGWAGFTKAVATGLPQADAEDAARRVPHPGAFEFDDPRPARWNLDAGVWLCGYWTHDWFDEVIRVGSYDERGKILALAAPHHYGIKGGATWGSARRRFFATNVLEELDAPGEWYLDRGRGLLYVYPPAAGERTEYVLATLAEPLVKLQGVRHVRLVDLAFEYGHADGIVAAEAEGVEVAGCRVANCAGGGIAVAGTGNTVRSCDLLHLGTYGIRLDGGDRASLTPAGNLAVNNHVHHFALFQRAYAPGIHVEGCGNVVRHNRIHDAPHNAVLYAGNEHLLELNEVYRVVLETEDAGAFYTGRDWTSQGNVVRHNFIHDLGPGDAGHANTMGVYLDDCDCGDTIVGNVFLRAGRAILIGGGRDNPVLNNLIVDCPIGLHLDARGIAWPGVWNDPLDPSTCLEEKARQIGFARPPWSDRYPRLAAIMADSPYEPLHNPIRRNVFVDCAVKVCDFDAEVGRLLGKLEIADNLVVNTTGAAEGIAEPVAHAGFVTLAGSAREPVDLGFVAREKGDFALRPGARLLEELPGFEPIPFASIGLFVDEHRPELPADGAGGRLLFTSRGKTGLVRSDGTGLRYLDLERPLQVTWQPGDFLSDGKRAVFLSMEQRRDGPGRPFDEYYTQTPCHLWLYDFDRGTLEEICQRGRLAPFMTPALLLSDDRILVQVVRDRVSQIYGMRLDGSEAREFTRAGEGVPYGLSLSPDGRRVAYHLAGPEGYQVWTSDVEGGDRVRVAGAPGHLYFGTQWSPDGRWILYVDCHEREDPGHDWADVCIGRADGGEHRVLTSGQAMWFAATYGDRDTRGGGSNVPTWTPEGTILFPRRLPDSKVPWEFAPHRPDVDHFNRDFRPELARGGTEIVELDPRDGRITALTRSDPPVWDFRAAISPDGREIAFCRAATGEAPALWVMQRDGSRPRRITQGIDGRGADHPRWLPAP